MGNVWGTVGGGCICHETLAHASDFVKSFCDSQRRIAVRPHQVVRGQCTSVPTSRQHESLGEQGAPPGLPVAGRDSPLGCAIPKRC